jgi:phage shock protein E
MVANALRRSLFLALLAFSAWAWAGDAYFVDVRTAGEYAEGHVSQAFNIPYEQITSRIGEVTADKDAVIYLYCRSGRRAAIAAEALADAGYSHVINLGTLEAARKKAAETDGG